MTESFPSIWIEINDKHKSKTLLGGFYRQWTNDEKKTVARQVEEIEEFCKQINEACTPNCKMIITGDANLCAQKWKLADFDKKKRCQSSFGVPGAEWSADSRCGSHLPG